jgi:hypothetical protein
MVVVVREDWPRLIHEATEIEMRDGCESKQKYLHCRRG